MKKLLAGGLVRDFLFGSEAEMLAYLALYAPGAYLLLDRLDCEEGCVIIRILTRYNDSPLIQLFEED